MKIKYFIPLFMFLVPTVIITYFVWPSEAFAPYPQQAFESIVGMIVMWTFMTLTFFLSIRNVIKDLKE